MKTTLGAIAGVLVGFFLSAMLAPRSGKETRNKVSNDLDYQLFKTRLAYLKLATRLGVDKRAKIAELTKGRIEKDRKNAATGDANPLSRKNEEKIKKTHEKDQAQKAVDGPTAKSQLRQVPKNTK